MIEKCVFTGRVAFIRNNIAYVVLGEMKHSYNLKYYRHLVDLEPEEKK